MNSPQPPTPLPVPDHELLRCVGRGSYGEVWLARSVMGTFRGVKLVRRSSFERDRPFEREFAGIQKYEPVSRTHPGLVNILHVGRGEGHFYYVMEVADDVSTGTEIVPDRYAPRTLSSELARRGRLPVGECVQLGLALTDALAHLHRHGLVHRDIKPSNIIFAGNAPKFADIGLVTGMGEQATLVGTAGYLAPEGPGAAPADLYSLGKVLYEISMGKDRDEFPELPTQLRELPESRALMQLNAVILKACEPDPRARFASAAEMHTALAQLARKFEEEGAFTTATRKEPGAVGSPGPQVVLLSPAGDTEADRLARALAERVRHENVGLAIDSPDQPSLAWARELERLLEHAVVVCVLLSPATVGSELLAYGVDRAWQVARRRGGLPHRVFVRVGVMEPLPKLFELAAADGVVLSWATAADDEPVAKALMDGLQRTHRTPDAPTLPPGDSPDRAAPRAANG